MTDIEKYKLFLVFLDIHGVLEDYQKGMNSEGRWREANNERRPVMDGPYNWLMDAFNWRKYKPQQGVSWGTINIKWKEVLRDLDKA